MFGILSASLWPFWRLWGTLGGTFASILCRSWRLLHGRAVGDLIVGGQLLPDWRFWGKQHKAACSKQENRIGSRKEQELPPSRPNASKHGYVALLRVKNTFIDDWASPVDCSNAPRARSLSLPATLRTRHYVDGMDGDDKCTSQMEIQDKDTSTTIPSSPAWSCTSHSRSGSISSVTSRSPELWRSAELNTLTGVSLTVKNTFIHIESDEYDEDEQGAMPCVKTPSMRLGRERFFSDGDAILRANKTPEARTLVAEKVDLPTAPENTPSFDVGTEVEIVGLAQNQTFNGCAGTVHSWDAKSGRYFVSLSHVGSSGIPGRFLLKGENLAERRPSCPSTTPRVGPVEPNGRFELDPDVGATDSIPCVPSWSEEPKTACEAACLFTLSTSPSGPPKNSPPNSGAEYRHPPTWYSYKGAQGRPRSEIPEWYAGAPALYQGY